MADSAPGRDRDRDSDGRARQARPRDELGRPLPYDAAGVEPVSEEPLPPDETVAYAREDHRVLALLVVKGGFGLGAGVLVLLSVFAERIFLAGAVGIGLLMGARGAGALVGPFLGRAFAGPDDRRLFTAIGLALATFGVCYVAFGITPSIAVALPVVFCAHLGGGGQWTLSTYGLQRLVPDRLRGRIFSFDFALVTLSIAVSSVVTGWAADRFGPRPAAIGLGAVALAWALTWWLLSGDIRRRGGLYPAARLADPGS